MKDRPRITLLGSQEAELLSYLQSDPGGNERAAIVLFRRLRAEIAPLVISDRYLAVKVVPFEPSWITSSSPTHISFQMASLRELFRQCEEENLVFGFVHNHPTDYPEFSNTDDQNELTLLSALVNRNGEGISFVSLLWTNQTWKARVRYGNNPTVPIPARHIIVLSDRVTVHGYAHADDQDAEVQARQAAAFGRPFTNILRSLRFGVVGGGGTGSAVAMLLARAGAGEIIVIDKDVLEKSNLNRVRGAAAKDVGLNKATILRDYILSLDIGVEPAAIQVLIDDNPQAIDALSSCDIVFGCTDDQIGREVLNSALYYYAQVFIDIGLGGEIGEDALSLPVLRRHHARISTILPEFGECLFCQGVITQQAIQFEYAKRENPNMSEEEAKERYLVGGGEDAPGIAPFTGAAADFAIAGLFDLIKPFRRFPGNVRKDFYKIDFVNMEICSQQKNDDPSCPFCSQRSFLLKRERQRLGRPALGARHEFY